MVRAGQASSRSAGGAVEAALDPAIWRSTARNRRRPVPRSSGFGQDFGPLPRFGPRAIAGWWLAAGAAPDPFRRHRIGAGDGGDGEVGSSWWQKWTSFQGGPRVKTAAEGITAFAVTRSESSSSTAAVMEQVVGAPALSA